MTIVSTILSVLTGALSVKVVAFPFVRYEKRMSTTFTYSFPFHSLRQFCRVPFQYKAGYLEPSGRPSNPFRDGQKLNSLIASTSVACARWARHAWFQFTPRSLGKHERAVVGSPVSTERKGKPTPRRYSPEILPTSLPQNCSGSQCANEKDAKTAPREGAVRFLPTTCPPKSRYLFPFILPHVVK